MKPSESPKHDKRAAECKQSPARKVSPADAQPPIHKRNRSALYWQSHTWNLEPSQEVLRARAATDSLSRTSSANNLVGGYLQGEFGDHLSDAQKAARAWYACNGKIEHEHTTGVYLRPAKKQGAAPILGVYVDSHGRLTDFSTNKEIYLARLANFGYAVSGIEFRLSKDRYIKKKRVVQDSPKQTELPTLSHEEEATVQKLASLVPEKLRASVSRAVRFSFIKQKANRS
ncbi:MAG: hypothetical protein ACOX4F_00380 [Atopobiaceae bacterium]|jgi:hypothetical protein